MPSLIGTDVAANYLKTSPSTQFGTRQLTFLKVVATESDGSTAVDFSSSYASSNSDFSIAVRTIQTMAEIYAVGTPDATGFIVIIADDTKNGAAANSNTQGTTYGALEAAIVANLANGGSSSATVSELTFDGVAIS